jgi:DNA ligase (NAD+)
VLDSKKIEQIIQQMVLTDALSIAELGDFCTLANTSYRAGTPIISDQDYDFIYLAALKKRNPKHVLLQTVEPEGAGFSEQKVLLPELMLSTDKAYSWDEIKKWLNRLEKSGVEIGLNASDIRLKATPKLDGFAGFDDGEHLYTRGDGKKGSDISRVFARGLQVYNDTKRGQGAGEIVVKKSYFEQHLADSFEYPRNFQASLIKEKPLDEKSEKAISSKAALFVPFAQLPNWSGNIEQLNQQFEQIVSDLLLAVDFDVDGVVFEAENADLKRQMGANRKFHRWQIAFKENKDKAQVVVLSVTAQVGRTGKITPVAELESTLLSGATIVRATGHHYGLVKEQGLGAGSVIELTRSGLVIPKINKVLKPAAIDIPKFCPSCSAVLEWQSDFLMCVNHQFCPAQIIGKMAYFFKILANNDGFGIATIEKLYEQNIRQISQIYTLTQSDFMDKGFGEKTSANLFHQLHRSHREQIEDWRFLAAFGVNRMGLGNGEILLKAYSIEDIFALKVEQVADIDGFAQISAEFIVDGLANIRDEFERLSAYKFNLEYTPLSKNQADLSHQFFAKKMVFSGKMSGARSVMKKQAKSIGIKVVDSVSRQTDYLIVGDKVGQKKIQSAKEFDVKIMSESEYLAQLALILEAGRV